LAHNGILAPNWQWGLASLGREPPFLAADSGPLRAYFFVAEFLHHLGTLVDFGRRHHRWNRDIVGRSTAIDGVPVLAIIGIDWLGIGKATGIG
jgi:hypothetical protein